jgi:ABC-type branched-subunit amino acid transport system substrate-binding protein
MSKELDLMGLGVSAQVAQETARAVEYAADDVATVATPTQAEMVTAFGAAAANKGKIGMIDDAGAGTSATLCVSNGTSWFYVATTVGAS